MSADGPDDSESIFCDDGIRPGGTAEIRWRRAYIRYLRLFILSVAVHLEEALRAATLDTRHGGEHRPREAFKLESTDSDYLIVLFLTFQISRHTFVEYGSRPMSGIVLGS